LKTLELGRIVKPHGLGGELKFVLHWPRSDALGRVSRIIACRNGEPDRVLLIEAVRGSQTSRVVKLVGIDDRDQAESLRGAALCVDRADLAELGPNEYYLADLVGARVSVGERELGTVVAVRPYPSADTMVIETGAGQLIEQPLLDCFLEEIDVAAGRVRLSSTDGLFDQA
jgi:16S rRNA processing protein RimM